MGRTTRVGGGESFTGGHQHFSHLHPLQTSANFTQSLHPNIHTQCCQNAQKSYDTLFFCNPCNFFIHATCAKLPQQITHPSHSAHTLTLLTESNYTNASFSCDACGKPSSGFTYNCSVCSFDLDTHCATIPELLQNAGTCHPHPLSLTYRCPYPEGYFTCDICKRKGSNVWMYRCSHCRFDVHLDCIQAGSAPAPPMQSPFAVGVPAKVPGGVRQPLPPGSTAPPPSGGRISQWQAPGPRPRQLGSPVYPPAQSIQPPGVRPPPSAGLFGRQVGLIANSVATMLSPIPIPSKGARPSPGRPGPYGAPQNRTTPKNTGVQGPGPYPSAPWKNKGLVSLPGQSSNYPRFASNRAYSFAPPAGASQPSRRPPPRSYSAPGYRTRPAGPSGLAQANMMLRFAVLSQQAFGGGGGGAAVGGGGQYDNNGDNGGGYSDNTYDGGNYGDGSQAEAGYNGSYGDQGGYDGNFNDQGYSDNCGDQGGYDGNLDDQGQGEDPYGGGNEAEWDPSGGGGYDEGDPGQEEVGYDQEETGADEFAEEDFDHGGGDLDF